MKNQNGNQYAASWSSGNEMGVRRYQPYPKGHSGGREIGEAAKKKNVKEMTDEELMTFAMGNCIVMEDTNGNRKLLKKRYDAKIDAVAAMIDAVVAYKLNREVFK